MPAHEHVNEIQFNYVGPSMGAGHHEVQANMGGGPTDVAHMAWNAKGIINVEVPPEHQRKGVATALWNEGHRLAETSKRIPAPKHSTDRTNEGDAWARSVGGRIPRKKR
jgi:GNAT superfamily N-acetyltransferase